MSKVEELAEIAADGVADGMHIVGEETLAAEKIVRGIEGMQLGYIALGVAIGGVVGGLVAFKLAYVRAETKYNEIAAQEISDMRDHFNAKLVAREAEGEKPSLEALVRENGYGDGESGPSEAPPMAVSAPKSVVQAARESADEQVADPRAEPRPIDEAPEVHNVFADAHVEDTWDIVAERRKRSPIKPYIIHVDERDDNAAYEGVTYTYYEADDVLANEREEVIGKEEREGLVGEENLDRFGHGSGDANLVYIRNDKLEMDMEIVRSNGSYSEEVHGFTPEPEPETRHRGRSSPDDE